MVLVGIIRLLQGCNIRTWLRDSRCFQSTGSVAACLLVVLLLQVCPALYPLLQQMLVNMGELA